MKKSNLLRRDTAKKLIPIMQHLIGILQGNLELVKEEEAELPPEDMSQEEWKKKAIIEGLKKELDTNKKVYDNNSKMLNMKLELELANISYLNTETKKCRLNKEIINIELSNPKVLNPTMAYQDTAEWHDKWKELKKIELEDIEASIKAISQNFENQKKKISTIDEIKIKEQQQNIEQRNPIILEQLRELGVNLDEVKEKHDYIG